MQSMILLSTTPWSILIHMYIRTGTMHHQSSQGQILIRGSSDPRLQTRLFDEIRPTLSGVIINLRALLSAVMHQLRRCHSPAADALSSAAFKFATAGPQESGVRLLSLDGDGDGWRARSSPDVIAALQVEGRAVAVGQSVQSRPASRPGPPESRTYAM